MIDTVVLITAVSTGYAGLFGACVTIAGLVGSRVERLEKTTDDRFSSVDDRFNRVDDRFNRVDDRFNRLETDLDLRFNRVDDHLSRIEDLITGMRASNAGFDARISTLEQRG